MKKQAGFYLLIFLMLVQKLLAGQTPEAFFSNEHFTFYKEDQKDYGLYIQEFEKSYDTLCQVLKLGKNHKITVKIFKDQKSFITEIMGHYVASVKSVGMTKPDQSTIYITSFYDTSTGRDTKEYLKVVRHEMVHVLFFNPHTWLSEGLALFLAKQNREMLSKPQNANELLVYINHNITNREAYGYYSFLTRFLIKKHGFDSFIHFYKSQYDWSILGYQHGEAFCEDAFNSLQQN